MNCELEVSQLKASDNSHTDNALHTRFSIARKFNNKSANQNFSNFETTKFLARELFRWGSDSPCQSILRSDSTVELEEDSNTLSRERLPMCLHSKKVENETVEDDEDEEGKIRGSSLIDIGCDSNRLARERLPKGTVHRRDGISGEDDKRNNMRRIESEPIEVASVGRNQTKVSDDNPRCSIVLVLRKSINRRIDGFQRFYWSKLSRRMPKGKAMDINQNK